MNKSDFISALNAKEAQGVPYVVLVGFGQYTMHFAVSLIIMRGIPADSILIVERGTEIGGCLIGVNPYAWFAAPFDARAFYPFQLYASCYGRLQYDELGLTCNSAYLNMLMIHKHFALCVYTGVEYAAVCDAIKNGCIVHPLYRSVISGRSAMHYGGIENVNLSSTMFNMIGAGSTTADVLVELVRRRCKSQGDNFNVKINYRQPRPYTCYLSSNALPPGVFPIYYMLLSVRKFDNMMFAPIQNPQLKSYRKLVAGGFIKWGGSKATRFAGIGQLLTAHPAIAERLIFNQVRDKADVQKQDGELLDCTNDYPIDATPEEELLLKKASFCPDLTVNLNRGNLPAAMMAQMLTAGGAMAHAMYATTEDDARVMRSKNYSSGAAQFDTVRLYSRYHYIGHLFAQGFHRASILQQAVGMLIFDVLIRFLTLTGATILFFHKSWFVCHPYISGIKAREISFHRWNWLSSETGYGSPFPVSEKDFVHNCSIPRCFSYDFLVEKYNALCIRLAVCCFVTVALYFKDDLQSYSTIDAIVSYVTIAFAKVADAAQAWVSAAF